MQKQISTQETVSSSAKRAAIMLRRYSPPATEPCPSEPSAIAIADGSLGHGSVAGGEYLRNMMAARLAEDDTVSWVEICFCNEPLAEERPYWAEYFELLEIKDASLISSNSKYSAQ